MKNYAVALACTIVTVALATTGCDKEVGGQPAPSAEATAGSPRPSRTFTKAPTVSEPLDATKYVTAPCASLTPAQYQTFEALPGTKDDPKKPTCSWKISTGATRLSILWIPEVSNGLSNIYAQHDTGGILKYFEPTTVSGYPAVYASVSDLRSSGECGLSVGVNDNLYFIAVVQTRAGNDSCTAAMNVAKAVIETVKRGA